MSVTLPYSVQSVETSAIVTYCTRRDSHPPNQRTKQSTRNVPQSANLQEASCSKTLLVDVYSKCNPHLTKRVYAIIDEQSNSSLITSELADDLGADGSPDKYFLSTCSREREEKYGQRVAGITAQSISGAEFVLPTLTECDIIPQDKCEIPTPSMARKFPHLTAIAHEIPPLDETAKVHLLIGQDALELLKVRESRNGPRGSPWGH